MDGPFRKRIRRRLYYGDKANMEVPSLPLTELSVEYFKDAVSQKLGHVEMESASDLIKGNNVSPCSLVLSMMYAKRLKQKNQDYLCTMSSSDVFFISMMMASKYLYDEGVDEEVFNDEWADSSEQDVQEVNQMEVDFLKAMDWHLFVRPDEFEDAVASIEKRLALQEGLKRGWFTYSELTVLADGKLMAGLWTNVGLEISKLTTLLSAAYLATLMSMLGSTALALQLAGPLSTATVAVLAFTTTPSLLTSTSPQVGYSTPPSARPVGDLATPDKSNYSEEPKHVWLDDHTKSPENWLSVNREAISGGQHQVAACSAGLTEAGAAEEPVESTERPAQPLAQASLWSLLFLDSLLTQLWSASSSTTVKRSSVNSSLHKTPSNHHKCERTTRKRHRLATNHPSQPDPTLNHPDIPTTLAYGCDRLSEIQDSPGSKPVCSSIHGIPNPSQLPSCCLRQANTHHHHHTGADQRWLADQYGTPGHDPFQPQARSDESWPGSPQHRSSVSLVSPLLSTSPGFHTSLPYTVQVT